MPRRVQLLVAILLANEGEQLLRCAILHLLHARAPFAVVQSGVRVAEGHEIVRLVALPDHVVLPAVAEVEDGLERAEALWMKALERLEAAGAVLVAKLTLGALERLAQGELSTSDDHVPVDITELLDRAAHDAMRVYPELDVSIADDAIDWPEGFCRRDIGWRAIEREA